MTFRGSSSSSSGSPRDRKVNNRRRLRDEQRKLLLEQLEDRRLLALGPQLGGIQPTDGNLLLDGDVRQVAPTDLTFRFDRDQQIDPATLNLATGVVGIQVVRSGNDGSFNDGNEVTITPGFLGVNAAPKQNEVVLRFKET
ncbi:MAG: hypothetical protein KDA59_16415, partial [Planctomycetales bacterium]|nr:hypothetical protein [Planctomycetales bacterium]